MVHTNSVSNFAIIIFINMLNDFLLNDNSCLKQQPKKNLDSFYCHDEILDYILHVLDKKHVDMLYVMCDRNRETWTNTKKN